MIRNNCKEVFWSQISRSGQLDLCRTKTVIKGRSGGSSGGAMTFCLRGLGSSSGSNFGIFSSDYDSILVGHKAFLIMASENGVRHFPSTSLFPIII